MLPGSEMLQPLWEQLLATQRSPGGGTAPARPWLKCGIFAAAPWCFSCAGSIARAELQGKHVADPHPKQITEVAAYRGWCWGAPLQRAQGTPLRGKKTLRLPRALQGAMPLAPPASFPPLLPALHRLACAQPLQSPQGLGIDHGPAGIVHLPQDACARASPAVSTSVSHEF